MASATERRGGVAVAGVAADPLESSVHALLVGFATMPLACSITPREFSACWSCSVRCSCCLTCEALIEMPVHTAARCG